MKLKQYLTEKTNTLYFGHPGPTYNTALEKRGIEEIKKKFSGVKIFNPAKIPNAEKRYKEEGFDMFFDAIDKTDFGVFMTAKDGRWGIGIYEEAYYMHKSGKKVWELDARTWEFTLVKNPPSTKYYALGLTKKGEVKRRIK